MPPNTKVRVTGTVAGNKFNATSISTTGAVGGIPGTGTTRVLTMLAYWTAPDSVTPERAASQMLTDSNGWYRDASYGNLGQVGDVTPWLQIAGPTTGCYADHLQLMSQAKTAAASLGYSLANYDNFVLYFPNCGGDSAGYAGWAYVGSTGTWLNGYMDRRVTVHEEGHNYGLWHSHSQMCSEGGLTGSCTFSDYGDPYDAMGSSGLVGHFNASQKSLLGWISSRIVNLSSGGSTTLVPMASDSEAPHAAVVALGTGRTYWLEYRQPVDYDAGLPLNGTDGVLVHVSGAGSGSSDSGASLIDVRSGDGISQYSSTLRAGQSWMTPEGTTISVGEVGPSGARVTVSTIAVPVARLSPSSISFGSVAVSSSSAASNVTLANSGSAALNIASITIGGTNSGDFVKGTSTCGASLAAGSSCSTPVSFRPSVGGSRSAILVFTDNAAGSPRTVTLAGTGVAQSIPTVTARSPGPGATGVSVGTSTTRTAMKATFSEAVTGVSGSSFSLKRGTTAVSAAVSYNATTRVATLTPSAALVADTTYTLTLTSAIKDPAGNPITKKSWNFITGPRPTVTTKTPASGATGVGRAASITATFSEAVTGIPTTAAASANFTIKQTSTGTRFASAASYNTTSRVATLNPSGTLLANTKYTVTLSSGVRDTAGNRLTTLAWSFTTGAT